MECENCNGKGIVDVLSCSTSAQDCCGGCTKEYDCNECNGTGEIDDSTSDEENEYYRN